MGKIRRVTIFGGIFAGLFLILATAWANSGKIAIQSTVDKSKITIGDVIAYTVTVTHAPNVRVKLPQLAENLGQFEIRDYHVFDPEKQNGVIVNRVRYKISTFEVGKFQIPPIAVQYSIPPDTVWHTLKSEAIKIEVESLAPSAEGDIKDIKPPVELPFDWKPLVRDGLAGLLILLLLGLGVYFWWRKKSGKPLLPQKAEPPRPPHEIALEALETLSKSGLLEKNQVKAYYSEISDIIRRYVAGRFGIDALDLTSTELLDELRQVALDDSVFEKISDLTDLADLVKFAKYRPTDEENARVLALAFDFVNETKVVAAPEEETVEETSPVAESESAETAPVSDGETAESGKTAEGE